MKLSLVQLFTYGKKTQVNQPWATTQAPPSTSTGFILKHHDELMIITNAHCATNATHISFKFAHIAKLYTATVERINHHCDLAILRCDDPGFQEKAVPLELADNLPVQGSKVSVHGFPNGNDYSMTKGELSRVDVSAYVHSQTNFLKCTLDVLMKPGNSGGPLIHEKKVVGVTHQGETNGGFSAAIPLPILTHFLQNPAGFPEISVVIQPLDNPTLHKKLGLQHDQGGVLIIKLDHHSCAQGILKEGDAILEIDNFAIDTSGMILHPVSGTPIHYTHAIRMHKLGDVIPVTLLRDKQVQTVEITLTQPLHKSLLIPRVFDMDEWRYYAVHGLVFVPLTLNYYQTLQAHKSTALVASRSTGSLCGDPKKTAELSKIFVIAKILMADGMEGLSTYEGCVVKEINGHTIGSMCDLVNAFADPQDGIHEIITQQNNVIALRHLKSEENQALLKRYGIAAECPEHVSNKLREHTHRRKLSLFQPDVKAPEEISTPVITASLAQ